MQKPLLTTIALTLILASTLVPVVAATPTEGEKATGKTTGADSAGAKKTPPAQIAAFTPPISLVDAGGFQDGGTTWVRLRDSKQAEILLCVQQDMFEAKAPPNTLFLGGEHAGQAVSRLPFSENEIQIVLKSLDLAVQSTLTKEEQGRFSRLNDPVMGRVRESLTKPEGQRMPDEQWRKIFAAHALQRLQSVKKHEFLTPDRKHVPAWYGAFEKEKNENLAEQRRLEEEDVRFKSYYPAAARVHFEWHPEPGLNQDQNERLLGVRLAKAVGDPVELAVISCKAIASIPSRGVSRTRDRIADHALKTVRGEDFAKALAQMKDQRPVLLGAAGVFFAHYIDKVPEKEKSPWAVRLAEVAVTDGADGSQLHILRRLARVQSAEVRQLLNKIAKGEVGKGKRDELNYGDEPGVQAHAYLGLAMQQDASIKDELAQRLARQDAPANRAAYEISLALLGNPKYLKKEHFKLHSYTIGMGSLQAIERFQGKHGLDVLVEGALNHPWAAVCNEAVLTAERITGERWRNPRNPVQERAYSEKVREWWKEHGAEFVEKRRQQQ